MGSNSSSNVSSSASTDSISSSQSVGAALPEYLFVHHGAPLRRINRDVKLLPFDEYDEVILYTGSLYGPHRAHVEMAKGVRDSRRLATNKRALIIVAPSAKLWLSEKMRDPKLAAAEEHQNRALALKDVLENRLELCAVAFGEPDCHDIVVSDVDYARRTIGDWDIVYQELCQAAGSKPVHYLCGSDSVSRLSAAIKRNLDKPHLRWSVIVVKRGALEVMSVAEHRALDDLSTMSEGTGTNVCAVHITVAGLSSHSSSNLRVAMADGRMDTIKSTVPAVLWPTYDAVMAEPPPAPSPSSRRRLSRKSGAESADRIK